MFQKFVMFNTIADRLFRDESLHLWHRLARKRRYLYEIFIRPATLSEALHAMMTIANIRSCLFCLVCVCV